MAVPMISTNFADVLDPRFEKIFYETYDQLPDMIPKLFNKPADNGRADMKWSEVGALGDWTEFTGAVAYDAFNQGYDTIGTHKEFVSGIQVERKLVDDDQFNVMDLRPQALATSAQRTRQKDAARPFNNAFSYDTFFFVNSEGVATCSASHTTTAPGVSTSTGFSNKVTTALTAVALTAARIQMQKFTDDRGNKYNSMPDELLVPIDLTDQANEILQSAGKVDSAENNVNVHKGKYKLQDWIYLSDTNNWFLTDSSMRKMMLHWVDRVNMEFKPAEDIDTLVRKYRGYMRYMQAVTGWRWTIGAQVS